ncbi:MAG: hypothetical protein Q7S53_01465 [bacterium]|nr:hypothetical protein [bacterium]
MNSDLLNILIEQLKEDKSIVLVGPTDLGKTHFVASQLLPALGKAGIDARMVKDCDEDFNILEGVDIAIFDEVETFIDREFLEKRHPEEIPYYTSMYAKKVLGWFDKLGKVEIPAVYIITRNEKEEVEYLVENMRLTDWGRKVKTLSFL